MGQNPSSPFPNEYCVARSWIVLAILERWLCRYCPKAALPLHEIYSLNPTLGYTGNLPYLWEIVSVYKESVSWGGISFLVDN